MTSSDYKSTHGARISRRHFVQGTAATGALMLLGGSNVMSFGEGVPQSPAVLSGAHFELTIDKVPVNITGHRRTAMGINGSSPGPTLRWREGDNVTIAVTNLLNEVTSIHWHGMRIPTDMDGVPGLSYPGIAPGETFHYRFPVLQNGTYWYHSHAQFQEQTGLLGAIVIEPRERDPVAFDREYVVLLSDWSDVDPGTIFSNLKQESDYYNYHRFTLANFISDAKKNGLGSTIRDRRAWAKMNMSPNDIADVSGAAYTYLLNGNSPNSNWTGLFEPDERVRLRFINGSSMTFFDVRIPGLPMTVVQADGNDVQPVVVDEFRMGVAETYDVIVEPKGDTAYTIFAQAEDRTGFARGTLTPRPGLLAVVPRLDPRPVRSMMDMGMAMGMMPGMNMSGMGSMSGMQMPEMEAAKKNGMSGRQIDDTPGSTGRKITGMNVADLSTITDAHGIPAGMRAGTGMTPFPQPGPNTAGSEETASEAMKLKASNPVELHPGPQVAAVPARIRTRLSDPGDGLEHNGRRVLAYADLRSRYRGVDSRSPTREIELHLTGNMERFIWGFNGKKFSAAEPIELKLGERVRIVLINDTMMEHPIHLHGLWSELENGHGGFNPFKHTIIVKPAERVSYLVSADTPGRWAYHCHLLYHMHAGMCRTVVVS